jgi:hypothetical protein
LRCAPERAPRGGFGDRADLVDLEQQSIGGVATRCARQDAGGIRAEQIIAKHESAIADRGARSAGQFPQSSSASPSSTLTIG